MGKFKHGRARTREHIIWKHMRTRCKNPNNPAYCYYGGRGITVDERWDDFAVFLADMGPCPSGLTLDRIDANGGYTPANCRWATRAEQSRNRRNQVYLTYRGETMMQADWARRLNIHPSVIQRRLLRGWTVEEALSTPAKAYLKE